jgi:hypothetical protein
MITTSGVVALLPFCSFTSGFHGCPEKTRPRSGSDGHRGDLLSYPPNKGNVS